jgi:hypothetical protein
MWSSDFILGKTGLKVFALGGEEVAASMAAEH